MSIRSQEQIALLTDCDSGSAYSTAYYTFFANYRFNWKNEQHIHTLLLSSPARYIGQATVTANMAIAAAKSGTPTILVDADLRNPSLEQRFGLEKGAGLGDLLAEKSVTTQQVQQHLRDTFIPGLRLLSTGMAVEGAPLLLSSKLKDAIQSMCLLLSETETVPGLIIFNCSPVLTGPDASLIGTLVEQTILIIAKDRTTRAQARQAQEQLARAHANLVGIVMLDV